MLYLSFVLFDLKDNSRIGKAGTLEPLYNEVLGITNLIIQQVRAMPICGLDVIRYQYNRYPAIYVGCNNASEILQSAA